MWRSILADALIAFSAMLLWYLGFRIQLRRRTREVLGWIQAALQRQGEIVDFHRLTASQFEIRLRMSSGLFHTCALVVQLTPREMPLNWLWYSLHRRPETVTFQADLEHRPTFQLEVANHRWYGKHRAMRKRNRAFGSHPVSALVMTTRQHWEFNGMVDALLMSRGYQFLRISFHRTSPHIRATVPLETFRPGSHVAGNIFETLRELAAGASASA